MKRRLKVACSCVRSMASSPCHSSWPASCIVSCVPWSSAPVDTPDCSRPCSSNTSISPLIRTGNTEQQDVSIEITLTAPLLTHCFFLFSEMVCLCFSCMFSISEMWSARALSRSLSRLLRQVLIKLRLSFYSLSHLVATLIALFFSCSNSALSFSAYS